MPSNPKLRIYDLQVFMIGDEDNPFIVTTDQRDACEFECQDFGVAFSDINRRPTPFYRFTAWHALRREGKTTLDWPAWNKKVRLVIDAPEPPPGAPGMEVADGTPLARGRSGRRAEISSS